MKAPNTEPAKATPPGVPADDDALIAAIASRADHDAFSALYDRYKDTAYNLALYLTGSVTLAEEAVQEAMLRIWTSARTYTPGNARGWILRIAARESLHKLKAQKKRQAKMEFDEAIDRHPATATQTDEVGRDEMLQALRAELAQLSRDEQQLVALHFGAGLSLREMSSELSVPHQTLHHQVTRLLNSLKSKLSTAGFAAAVPLINANNIGEAIITGGQCPAGLRDSIMTQLSMQTAAQSARAAALAGKSASTGWTTGLVIAGVLAVGGAAYVGFAGKTSSTPAAPARSAAAGEHFHRIWSFKDGPVEEGLRVNQGQWKWESSKAHGGYMVAGKDPVTLLVLPSKTPSQIVEVRIKHFFTVEGRWSLALMPMRNGKFALHTNWSKFLGRTFRAVEDFKRSRETVLYAIGRHTISQQEGTIYCLRQLPEGEQITDLSLAIENWCVQSIEMRTLKDNEIPAVVRDIPGLIRSLNVTPTAVGEYGKESPLPARDVKK